jgi:hypothetical protein
VNRDILIDLGNPVTVLAWWPFSETSGGVATNYGTLGPAANGAYSNGVTLNVAGPRSPGFPGFSTNNTAASFDGVNDYVRTTNGLMNSLNAFTIAGWINPTTGPSAGTDLFGQLNIVGLAFTGGAQLEFDGASKKLKYAYPYGPGQWHHIAGVGDAVNMYIYVDGVLVGSRSDPALPDYGSNTNPFNIGGNVFGTGNYFNGLIDEVVVYDRALSASEIAQLYAGQVP